MNKLTVGSCLASHIDPIHVSTFANPQFSLHKDLRTTGAEVESIIDLNRAQRLGDTVSLHTFTTNVPSLTLFTDTMSPVKSTNDGNPPKRPNLLESLLQGWQCWALRNPRNIFSRMFLPFVAWVDGFAANKSTYLDRKRR